MSYRLWPQRGVQVLQVNPSIRKPKQKQHYTHSDSFHRSKCSIAATALKNLMLLWWTRTRTKLRATIDRSRGPAECVCGGCQHCVQVSSHTSHGRHEGSQRIRPQESSSAWWERQWCHEQVQPTLVPLLPLIISLNIICFHFIHFSDCQSETLYAVRGFITDERIICRPPQDQRFQQLLVWRILVLTQLNERRALVMILEQWFSKCGARPP